MAARYLLDTNVLSDFVRGDEAVQTRLRAASPADIAVSTVTVMEVQYGLALTPSRAQSLRPALDGIFSVVEMLSLTVADARAAGSLRAALRRCGRPIGPYDVLLAGCALARGLVLVTANVGEFKRVEGLVVENWKGEA